MRDLLFLAHRVPFPPDKGDKIRSFHILKHLSSSFRIHLGCFSDTASDSTASKALEAFCADVFCIPLGSAKKIRRILLACAQGKAISEATYFDPRMTKWIAGKIHTLPIADAFVFCSVMFPYIAPYTGRMRTVIDIVDVDSEKWGAYSETAPWPLSAIYKREQQCVRDLEKAAVQAADVSLFVSHAEAMCFAKIAPNLQARAEFLQNGVDLERFSAGTAFPSPFPARSAIVFTGAMDYRPNVDAVEWFARAVLPRILSIDSGAEFWIVGARPTARVKRLAGEPGIHITGYVPDVRPYLANAACVVAPLLIARGVQNKVLEAMAMGKPIVVSPAALEGIPAISGEEVLVARDAVQFADAVVEVLAGKWTVLGRNARLRAESVCCWSRNLAKLDRIMASAPRAIADGRSTKVCAEAGALP